LVDEGDDSPVATALRTELRQQQGREWLIWPLRSSGMQTYKAIFILAYFSG
jgi:hypothetical protein